MPKKTDTVSFTPLDASLYEVLDVTEVPQRSLRRVVRELQALLVQRTVLYNKLIEQYALVVSYANTDPLTGTHNRRYFNEVFNGEIQQFMRDGGIPMAIVLLDIDHFKRINDTYGHPAGDLVLTKMGEVLHAIVRSADLCARYGGEEFIIMLRHVDAVQAQAFAERLRVAIKRMIQLPMRGETVTVEVSMGFALLRANESGQDVITRADKALYRAKKAGRNRIVFDE